MRHTPQGEVSSDESQKIMDKIQWRLQQNMLIFWHTCIHACISCFCVLNFQKFYKKPNIMKMKCLRFLCVKSMIITTAVSTSLHVLYNTIVIFDRFLWQQRLVRLWSSSALIHNCIFHSHNLSISNNTCRIQQVFSFWHSK